MHVCFLLHEVTCFCRMASEGLQHHGWAKDCCWEPSSVEAQLAFGAQVSRRGSIACKLQIETLCEALASLAFLKYVGLHQWAITSVQHDQRGPGSRVGLMMLSC